MNCAQCRRGCCRRCGFAVREHMDAFARGIDCITRLSADEAVWLDRFDEICAIVNDDRLSRKEKCWRSAARWSPGTRNTEARGTRWQSDPRHPRTLAGRVHKSPLVRRRPRRSCRRRASTFRPKARTLPLPERNARRKATLPRASNIALQKRLPKKMRHTRRLQRRCRQRSKRAAWR